MHLEVGMAVEIDDPDSTVRRPISVTVVELNRVGIRDGFYYTDSENPSRARWAYASSARPVA